LWVIFRYWFSSDIYKDYGGDILDALSEADQFTRWMANTILPYLGPDVMELGAGMGNLTRLLARRRHRYVATDIDREHLGRLRSRLQHRPNLSTAVCDAMNRKDCEEFAGQMDSIVCLNVLEHIEDDLAALRNVHYMLRPGGRAIILVPQGSAIYGTLDQALGHFRRYSKEELVARMEASGLRLEELIEFNRITYPAWYVNGRILRKRTFSRFQLSVFDWLVPLWRRIDRWLPWPATSIIAIGLRDTSNRSPGQSPVRYI